MKPFILVFISFLLSIKIYSQETSNICQLELMSGKIETYYVKGYKEKAEYLQLILEDAVRFYEKSLNDTFSFELFVLDRKTWKKYTDIPYPVPHYINSEKKIIMPIYSFYKIHLPAGDSIYGKAYYYFTDFAAFHELGHYIARKQGARSYSKWSSESFADFILVAYMHEIIPRFKFSNKPAKFFPFLPLKYKSLEKYGSADIVNEMFYHSKFQELANQIYLKHGLNFMFDYLHVYKQLSKDIKDGKFENVTVTKELVFQNSIKNIQSIEPDIFNEWNKSMRRTYHSWLILFGLVLLIGIIRLTNTSYSIFTNLKLKTKRIYRIFGIPTIRIWYNLKNIKSKSIKIKLIRISVFRIINFFLISALILSLVLLFW
ncbi:MAG: hypothetical protein KAT38_01780 [Bacteroidales bacterium]|nr:hypothetical protein [Bacteroidales bacterium]